MKIRWVQIIGIFGSILCVLWLVGLGMTFKHYFFKGATEVNQSVKTEIIETLEDPINETTKSGYNIVALGDSLTVGAGDLNGKGYVGNILEQLKDRTMEEVSLQNFAINGLTSEGLVKVIEQRDVKQGIKDADLILLTIGGNDLFQGGQTLVELNLEEIAQIEQRFLENLSQILSDISQLNGNAPIYFSGLYHPFTHLPNTEITTKVILDWNHHTALVIARYNQAVFVPTFDMFQNNLTTHLSHDRFHPSTEGYQQMANRIFALITWDGEKNE